MTNRRDLLSLPILLAPAALEAKDRLPNAVRQPGEIRPSEAPFGDLRIFFDGPTEQLGAMTAGSLRLKPGQSPHPPHQHPEEEFMLITEGTGEMVVDGVTTKVGPGSMMYCAAERLHGITNTGRKPLLFYFWKWKA